MNIPKIVHVVVKGAQNLKCTSGGSKKPFSSSKKAPKTCDWRVVFIGGPQKQATALVEEPYGCPTWNSKATIELISPLEPVVLRVVTGENHHVGEVRIPLQNIQFTTDPTTDMNKMHHVELAPTKKNKHPQGVLLFWIWVTGFWPPGTPATKPKSRFRRKAKGSSMNDDCASSMLSFGGGGGASGGSMFCLNTRPPNASYNPLDDDAASSGFIQSNSQLNGKFGPTGLAPPVHQSHLNIPYAQSELGTGVDTVRHHKSAFGRVRSKLSRSTANLAEIFVRKAVGGKHHHHHHQPSHSNLNTSMDQICYPGAGSMQNIVAPNNRAMLQTLMNIAQDTPSQDPVFNPNQRHDDSGCTTPIRTDGVGEPGPLDSPSSGRGSHRGMHAEERPNKAIEGMSRREAVEFATQLQKTVSGLRSENTRLQNEQQRLQEELTEKEEELNTTRLKLAMLKNRLLEDNQTQYLEVSPNQLNGFYGDALSGPYGGSYYGDPYQQYGGSSMLGNVNTNSNKSYGLVGNNGNNNFHAQKSNKSNYQFSVQQPSNTPNWW